MPLSTKSIVVCGCLVAVITATVACSPRRIPAMTVSDLMEDRVTLDGVLMKCNQNPSKAHSDADCLNARIAIDRLASQNEPAEEAKRAVAFERSREQLRLTQEKTRREQESKAQVDAYHLPLVPVDSTPAPSPPTSATSPPIARENP
jgi:uncharacterized protein YaiL (DUF2058 family)